jgi:hypothetical protein
MYWLTSHADAAWSAGFIAVWLKLIGPDDDPPYPVVYTLAGLVVDGLVRPIEREGRTTLYQYIKRSEPRFEELRLLNPDEADWPTPTEVRSGG